MGARNCREQRKIALSEVDKKNLVTEISSKGDLVIVAGTVPTLVALLLENITQRMKSIFFVIWFEN